MFWIMDRETNATIATTDYFDVVEMVTTSYGKENCIVHFVEDGGNIKGENKKRNLSEIIGREII